MVKPHLSKTFLFGATSTYCLGMEQYVYNSTMGMSVYSFFSYSLCVYHVRGAYDKFPDFFCVGTFIDSTHMKL